MESVYSTRVMREVNFYLYSLMAQISALAMAYFQILA